MVPEWRNQYLDYHGLDAALTKAVENKNIKSREKGVDLYFELIKFNQKFANYFSRECQAQLEKINSFHKEKLSEMKGKYNNLQDQLDQVLSSAVYREIQPHLSLAYNEDNRNSDIYNTVTSISDLFKNLKDKIGMRPDHANTVGCGNDRQQSSRLNISHNTHRLSSTPIFKNADDKHSFMASNPFSSRLTRKRVLSCARKLSESFANSAHKLTNNIGSLTDGNYNSSMNTHPSGNHHYPLEGVMSNALSTGANNSQTDVDLQHLQTKSETTPQSKKKIISSYKNKINQLKFAFRELYFNLVLFEQYTQLNYTGFEQILRKHDRMFASTLGRKFYQEHVQTADFYNDLQTIDHLIEGVEHVYTLHFENGNRRKAIKKLQVPSNVYKPSSPMLDFRVGYELGMFAVLFILVLLVGYLSDTGYDWRTVFRLYRSPLVLIIFLFQAGISIVIWKHYKINHVLIFELNPRNNLSFHHFLEFASLLGIIWSISVLLFLFSESLSIRPSICPLVVVVIVVSYLFNPTATCQYRARFWLIRILGRIFSAPLNPVRFADFWIADQLVSIVPLFLDLEYLSCFYTTGEVLSVSHLSHSYVSRCVTRNPQDLVIRTIVAALPAWFRCAQCLRRWRDENWLTLHLANAGKYGCMVSVVVLSSISQYNKSSFELDTMRIIWLIAAIFTSSLTAYWDIIYDFGLFNTYDSQDDDEEPTKPQSSRKSFNGSIASKDFPDEFNLTNINRQKRKKWPFLRKELVYPVWVYYFAIIENWILRFGWIITISLTEFSNIETGLAVSLLAPMEMFRRFVWNCIRLENEQLNNCGLFRAVRDIPIEVVAPIDESHLDKVIMMMDSRDGPSMRNRLMKRRTLRPDRVSFMVLHQPNSSKTVTRRFDHRK